MRFVALHKRARAFYTFLTKTLNFSANPAILSRKNASRPPFFGHFPDFRDNVFLPQNAASLSKSSRMLTLCSYFPPIFVRKKKKPQRFRSLQNTQKKRTRYGFFEKRSFLFGGIGGSGILCFDQGKLLHIGIERGKTGAHREQAPQEIQCRDAENRDAAHAENKLLDL